MAYRQETTTFKTLLSSKLNCKALSDTSVDIKTQCWNKVNHLLRVSVSNYVALRSYPMLLHSLLVVSVVCCLRNACIVHLECLSCVAKHLLVQLQHLNLESNQTGWELT